MDPPLDGGDDRRGEGEPIVGRTEKEGVAGGAQRVAACMH
jgi:hypothetical protein